MSKGGRPKDKFVMHHAKETGDKQWKCDYCGRLIKGSTRLKNHLSGLGNDITVCKSVPKEVKEEASKQVKGYKQKTTSKKRQLEEDNTTVATFDQQVSSLMDYNVANLEGEMIRNTTANNSLQIFSSSAMEATLQGAFSSVEDPNLGLGVGLGGGASSTLFDNPNVSSSSVLQDLISRNAEESVIGAVLKFFMCTNSEFINDPNFETFLKTVQQHGIPSRLLMGNRFVVHRVMTNIEEEVYDHMSKVQESWATTGCTLMVFNLKVGEYVYGFYSSKGFIFVKADAWMSHSPNLDITRVTQYMHHPKQYSFILDHFCDLSDQERSNPIQEIPSKMNYMTSFSCVRAKIKGECIRICKESEWAWSLITKAGEIHKLIIIECYLSDWYIKTLEIRTDFKQFAGGELDNPLSRFISIILIEDYLKERLSYPVGSGVLQHQIDLEALILDNPQFWDDGKKLKRALAPVLKIPYLMDTLVPTAGYIDMAIDKAKYTIFSNDQRPMQEDTFWRSLETFLDDNASTSMRQPVAAYLNPAYFWSDDVHKNRSLEELVHKRLRDFVQVRERDEMDKQLQIYSNESSTPFKRKGIVFREHHPVELWELHGKGLPLLQKYAIQILSQPVSCMCNQVKEYMLHLEGRDDYILRLNVRMMEKFRSLGGNSYRAPLN